MDEPVRHREILPRDIERMRRMSPTAKLAMALDLSDLGMELAAAGRRWRDEHVHRG